MKMIRVCLMRKDKNVWEMLGEGAHCGGERGGEIRQGYIGTFKKSVR